MKILQSIAFIKLKSSNKIEEWIGDECIKVRHIYYNVLAVDKIRP